MVRIGRQAFRLFFPASAEVFIRRKSFERFKSLGEVIGHEVEAMIGASRVDFVGHGGPHVPEEPSRAPFGGFCLQLGIGTCASPVHGDKSGTLACFRADLREVDREGAEGRGLARLRGRLLARDLR
jgi:hypothetical protein